MSSCVSSKEKSRLIEQVNHSSLINYSSAFNRISSKNNDGKVNSPFSSRLAFFLFAEQKKLITVQSVARRLAVREGPKRLLLLLGVPLLLLLRVPLRLLLLRVPLRIVDLLLGIPLGIGIVIRRTRRTLLLKLKRGRFRFDCNGDGGRLPVVEVAEKQRIVLAESIAFRLVK